MQQTSTPPNQNLGIEYQKHINLINFEIDEATKKCTAVCEKLRDQAEAEIAQLNPKTPEAETEIKLKLKHQLDEVIDKYIHELSKKFLNDLYILEEINRRREQLYLEQVLNLLISI